MESDSVRGSSVCTRSGPEKRAEFFPLLVKPVVLLLNESKRRSWWLKFKSSMGLCVSVWADRVQIQVLRSRES